MKKSAGLSNKERARIRVGAGVDLAPIRYETERAARTEELITIMESLAVSEPVTAGQWREALAATRRGIALAKSLQAYEKKRRRH